MTTFTELTSRILTFLKNWYLRDQDGYIGIHIYFKNASNFYYPWELQIWDEKDAENNIKSHQDFKRSFVK